MAGKVGYHEGIASKFKLSFCMPSPYFLHVKEEGNVATKLKKNK